MITAVAIGGFVFAGLCALVRVLVGPSLADRVAALDVVLLSAMGAIAVAGRRDDPSVLIVLVVMAVVGFTATVAAARYIVSEEKS